MQRFTIHYICKKVTIDNVTKWVITKQLWDNHCFNCFTGKRENRLLSREWVNNHYDRTSAEDYLTNVYGMLKSKLKKGDEIVFNKTSKLLVVTIHYD